LNILFSISHPAHVHFFRHAISILRSNQHKVVVVARDKDITLELLNNYGIKHEVLTKKKAGISGFITEFFAYQYLLSKILRANKIDLVLSIGAALNAHVCFIMGIPCYQFCDTEAQWRQNNITYPFVTKLFTPSYYIGNNGSKHIRYEGYHELAYLHPNSFKPDKTVLNDLGIVQGEKFVVLRFVSWQATHDIGQTGLTLEMKMNVVNEISKYARIFITSEAPLPRDLKKYQINIPPERIHDMLHYASLYLGESPTMTTESAILGTPAICVSSWAGDSGNFIELYYKYKIIECYNPVEVSINDILSRAIQVIEENEKENWVVKREKLLKDKIDVTQYLVNIVKSC